MNLVAVAMKRMHLINELLSTQELPEVADGEDAAVVADQDYLTVADAAKLLQVGEDTIERMIGNGELPVIQITGRGNLGGRKLKRIARDSLDAAMKKRELKQQDQSSTRKRSSSGSDQRDYFA